MQETRDCRLEGTESRSLSRDVETSGKMTERTVINVGTIKHNDHKRSSVYHTGDITIQRRWPGGSTLNPPLMEMRNSCVSSAGTWVAYNLQGEKQNTACSGFMPITVSLLFCTLSLYKPTAVLFQGYRIYLSSFWLLCFWSINVLGR